MIQQILQGPSSGRWPTEAPLTLDTPKATVPSGGSPWSQRPSLLMTLTPLSYFTDCLCFPLFLSYPPEHTQDVLWFSLHAKYPLV